MREIKFRAWHTKKNCWLPDWLYRMLSGSPLVEAFEYETASGLWVFSAEDEAAEDEYLLEQRYPLPLPNSEVVFEGDIDSKGRVVYQGEFEVEDQEDVGSTWVVGWFLKDKKGRCTPLTSQYPIEVIGNIHENPELFND